jgi:hypothetical protein
MNKIVLKSNSESKDTEIDPDTELASKQLF